MYMKSLCRYNPHYFYCLFYRYGRFYFVCKIFIAQSIKVYSIFAFYRYDFFFPINNIKRIKSVLCFHFLINCLWCKLFRIVISYNESKSYVGLNERCRSVFTIYYQKRQRQSSGRPWPDTPDYPPQRMRRHGRSVQ